jgi:galactose mutarotase-like enzyme
MEVTMSTHILKNEYLTLQIDELGAELISICDNGSNTQYLWNGSPDYWKRHSPILFPFVGTAKNKSYSYQGKVYPVTQHGFARDSRFTLLNHTEDEIWLVLEDNEATRDIYPFEFRLELGYRLQDKMITVLWRVINRGQTVMYFSIGGHPAFNCPLNPGESQNDYYFMFDTFKPIRYLHINESGLVKKKPFDRQNILSTDQGILPVDSHMFDYDALIIENNQCQAVTLLDSAKAPYITVTFDAPLFGLWSPAKKNAPFVCIEPWYGRCDADDFDGTLEEREYGNTLKAGGVFEACYTIEIV